MIDVRNLYTKAWNEVPKPQHIPGGHWLLQCTGVGFIPAKVNDAGKEISARLGYFYVPVSPMGDVDKKALSQLNGYDFTDEDLNTVAYFDWYGGARERAAHAEHIAKHSGVSPEGAILEPTEGDESTPRVRKEFRTSMIGGQIVAKLKPGVGPDGSPRMEVEKGTFMPATATK